LFPSLACHGLRVFTQDAQSKWIGEEAIQFANLMSRTVICPRRSGLARSSGLA
jgi:hypothetical protein